MSGGSQRSDLTVDDVIGAFGHPGDEDPYDEDEPFTCRCLCGCTTTLREPWDVCPMCAETCCCGIDV